ncbi:hypothetical protein [Mycoplana ramosa]|uniref:Uncharacterized protein n=1 Tax=Mycoplana ramosa TaxID=40837 RepID=A0ABW3YTE2_MYCRA
MAGFLKFAEKYAVKENKAVEAFRSALTKQSEAFEKGEVNRRSWVKPDGSSFVVKLGKLDGTYVIPTKQEVTAFLTGAANASRDDSEFIALIESVYGEPLGEEPKPRRGRKPKAQAAEVHTDVIRLNLKSAPRSE